MMSRINKNFKQAEPAKPELKTFSKYLKIAFCLVFVAGLLAAFFMV